MQGRAGAVIWVSCTWATGARAMRELSPKPGAWLLMRGGMAREKGRSHAGAVQTKHAGEGWPTSLDSRVLGHAQGNGPVGLLQNGPAFGSLGLAQRSNN